MDRGIERHSRARSDSLPQKGLSALPCGYHGQGDTSTRARCCSPVSLEH